MHTTKISASTIVAMLVAMLTIAVNLAAQEPSAQGNTAKHHQYKLIDLGTFGGPMSRNDGIYPALNNVGTVIGVADTSALDPFYPNFNPFILPGGASDPYIFRAFESNNGQLVALDSLPDGDSAFPSSISENGLIAGNAINGALDPIAGWPEENAVFWLHGKITDLGTLGGYESGAGMVNSRGQVTGFAQNAILDPYSIIYSLFTGGQFANGTQTRAFVWEQKHGMQDLGTLGGPDAISTFINERGEVAGVSYTSYKPNSSGYPTIDPFLWEPPTQTHPNGKMIDMGSLGGTSGGEGDGVAINNPGQVVGSSNLVGDAYFHPFLWTKPGPMQDLGTLGGPTGAANAINDSGEVVGLADTAPGAATLADAFLWKNGSMTDLGTLSGDCFSDAFAINARTQVVGNSISCDFTVFRATLWENGGPMVDLNALVSGADMTMTGATSINDRGEITGTGVLANGDVHVFMLIPCNDDHPEVEDCDYSMLESAEVGNSVAAAQTQQAIPQTTDSLVRVMNASRNPFMRRWPRSKSK